MLDCYLLEACYFLMKNGKVVDKEEKGTGRKRRGSFNNDVLYEKETTFNKEQKQK